MDPKKTALVLIGYQNDYFAQDGILHGVIEGSTQSVLDNTMALIRQLEDTDVMIITTPINFTPDYSELIEPVGILEVIKQAGAFKAGTTGAKPIPEFVGLGKRIIEIPGKRGLNAFASTDLDQILKKRGITTLALAGAITSICIDSTGRAAFEKGYKVVQLSDCLSSRTSLEESFYCSTVFPLYATVMDSKTFAKQLRGGKSEGAGKKDKAGKKTQARKAAAGRKQSGVKKQAGAGSRSGKRAGSAGKAAVKSKSPARRQTAASKQSSGRVAPKPRAGQKQGAAGKRARSA